MIWFRTRGVTLKRKKCQALIKLVNRKQYGVPNLLHVNQNAKTTFPFSIILGQVESEFSPGVFALD